VTAVPAPELPGDAIATVDVDGVATRHLSFDGGGEPVVLLHGSGPGVTAWANWRLAAPTLAAAGFRVFAPDLQGFGGTDPAPDGDHHLGRWLDHLRGYLDTIGVARAHLVGNSFGGALALHLAAEDPHRVDRLVLMGAVGAPFTLTDGLDAVWGYEPSLDAMRRLVELFAHDPAIATDDLVRLRYAASLAPGVQEAYATMFPAPRQRHVDALVLDEARLRALPHRTLVVHGRDDRIVPVATSHHLAARIDDSELHVFGRCGHWTQLERADAFHDLVRGFLRRPA
jgi:pimeloyl-ACP methyl ester carboxylesterase